MAFSNYIDKEDSNSKRKVILITGFKSFGVHIINESEMLVQWLSKNGILSDEYAEVIFETLDVDYDYVERRLKSLWQDHDILLAIHLGVHNDDVFRIERLAHKSGYNRRDVNGNIPRGGTCPIGVDEVIETQLDLDNLTALEGTTYPVHFSKDAGLYLCEYVFYISLSHDPSRVIFIHVPPNRGDMTVMEEKGAILKHLILQLVSNCSFTLKK